MLIEFFRDITYNYSIESDALQVSFAKPRQSRNAAAVCGMNCDWDYLALFFVTFYFVLCYNVSMNENTTVTEAAVQESMQEICHILTTSDEKLAYDFIECLFTPAERRDIANRWLLVKEIDKGTTQREIARKFGMSLCKITRGSKELAKPDSAFRKILDSQKK